MVALAGTAWQKNGCQAFDRQPWAWKLHHSEGDVAQGSFDLIVFLRQVQAGTSASLLVTSALLVVTRSY